MPPTSLPAGYDECRQALIDAHLGAAVHEALQAPDDLSQARHLRDAAAFLLSLALPRLRGTAAEHDLIDALASLSRVRVQAEREVSL